MLKFLFGKMGKKPVIATQRQIVARAVEDLNGILAVMAVKPVVGVDLNTGLVSVDLPDQMPDEALALPAPTAIEPASRESDANESDAAMADPQKSAA